MALNMLGTGERPAMNHRADGPQRLSEVTAAGHAVGNTMRGSSCVDARQAHGITRAIHTLETRPAGRLAAARPCLAALASLIHAPPPPAPVAAAGVASVG